MAKGKDEKEPEVFEEEGKGEEKEEKEEIVDFTEEELTLDQFLGKVIILEHAEITEGENFNTIHMTVKTEDGKEYNVRTSSKAIDMVIRRLLDKGLNNGKMFRVCVQQKPSKFKQPMFVFVNPSLCKK